METRIAQLRMKRQMTQKELAEKAKISKFYLSRIEKGGENPTLMILARIANALDCGIGDILMPSELPNSQLEGGDEPDE